MTIQRTFMMSSFALPPRPRKKAKRGDALVPLVFATLNRVSLTGEFKGSFQVFRINRPVACAVRPLTAAAVSPLTAE